MIGEKNNLTTLSEIISIESLDNVNDKIYYIVQAIAVVHNCLCFFWLVYVSIDLFKLIRNKHRMIIMQDSYEYNNKVFIRNENIFRNVIFLMFLTCEIVFSSNLNIYGFIIVLHRPTSINISIGSNCSLDSISFIGKIYDTRLTNIFLIGVEFLDDISFSMMLWLFGASLLHLSFAARNDLRVKTILKFILFGIIAYLCIEIFQILPITSLFGIFIHSIMDQMSLFIVVLFIAKKKFIPAMNSRVIDAFHLHNQRIYLQQKRLLKQYKVLIFVFSCTFEIFILKDMFLFNLFIMLDTISYGFCWFNVNYDIPMLTLSKSTQYILLQIGYISLMFGHVTIILVYLNFIVVNLNLIYVIARKCLKRRFTKITYRYQICSEPLLP